MKIGIDLGGSHIGVGIVNENDKLVLKKEIDLQIDNNSNTEEIKKYLEDRMISLINESLREVGAPMCVIESIGVAVPRTSRKWNSKKIT